MKKAQSEEDAKKAQPNEAEMKKTQSKEAKSKAKNPATFSKKQLLESRRFSDRRDMVNALLEEEGRYTLDEVEKRIEEFLKGRVN